MTHVEYSRFPIFPWHQWFLNFVVGDKCYSLLLFPFVFGLALEVFAKFLSPLLNLLCLKDFPIIGYLSDILLKEQFSLTLDCSVNHNAADGFWPSTNPPWSCLIRLEYLTFSRFPFLPRLSAPGEVDEIAVLGCGTSVWWAEMEYWGFWFWISPRWSISLQNLLLNIFMPRDKLSLSLDNIIQLHPDTKMSVMVFSVHGTVGGQGYSSFTLEECHDRCQSTGLEIWIIFLFRSVGFRIKASNQVGYKHFICHCFTSLPFWLIWYGYSWTPPQLWLKAFIVATTGVLRWQQR